LIWIAAALIAGELGEWLDALILAFALAPVTIIEATKLVRNWLLANWSNRPGRVQISPQ
jgi:hypothetical protein